MRLLVISWETARSRAARRRWRELTARGEMSLRPEPPARYSRLHLQRGLRRNMICGVRGPENEDAFVINSMGDYLERVGRVPEVRANFERAHSGPCVNCAVTAAMEVDHVLLGMDLIAEVRGDLRVEGSWLRVRCGCGWVADVHDSIGPEPRDVYERHVEQVVRGALLDSSMSPAERQLFSALEAA